VGQAIVFCAQPFKVGQAIVFCGLPFKGAGIVCCSLLKLPNTDDKNDRLRY
jgi:hypothetical protein